MRRYILLTATTILVLLQPLWGQELHDPLQQISPIVQELCSRTGAPGISVAVSVENELRFAQGFGYADLEHGIPVTTETRFRTASIAKPLTAVVVLALSEARQIDLDLEVQEYAPTFPEKQWPVTTRQLLGHLGGVRHYKSSAESLSTSHYQSVNDGLKVFSGDPLKHQPGSKFLYSTFGYNLLGAIAEGAGGEGFMALLHRYVLEPSGMEQTVEDDHSAIIANRSRGYIRSKKNARLKSLPHGDGYAQRIENAPLHDTSMKIPGGGLLSTSGDLVRFATSVNTGRLLSPSGCQQMWTRQTKLDGTSTAYGLGWKIGQHKGWKLVSHSGGQAGTSTLLILFPETGIAVALMCNLQDVALTATAKKIADLFLPCQQRQTDYSMVVRKLQAAVEHEVKAKQLPALSIALVDGDRTVWSKGFGHQDAEKSVPASADTIFRLGSFAKLLTSVAAMKTVEAGKLDLDTPISKLVPSLNRWNAMTQPLTLRQLLSHRSGMVREPPVGNHFDPTPTSLTATVESLNETTLVYPPDSRTKISNAAFAVVGAALENAWSKSCDQIFQAEIFNPLGMTASSLEPNPSTESRLADGWMRTYDLRLFQAPQFVMGTGPAENLYSNVNDMAKFLSWMMRPLDSESNNLLTSSSFEELVTPSTDSAGKPLDYGLGFRIQEFDGYRQVGHAGGVYGHSAQLQAIPERRAGIVAVSALEGSHGTVSMLTDYGLRLLLAAQDGTPLPDYPITVAVSPDRAALILGRYQHVETDEQIHISELAGTVYLRKGTSRHEVRSNEKDGTLVVDDPSATGARLVLQSPDRILFDDQPFDRVSEQIPEDIPDPWRGLIGEYGWDHSVLTILEDAGSLTALVEWLYYYPLQQLDQDTFRFPDHGLYQGEELKFARDASGRATRVIAAGVTLERRNIEPENGATFQIQPIRPVEELHAEAQLAAPPQEVGDFRKSELMEVTCLDPTIRLDIRYATNNNFTGATFYNQARAFLQAPAAEALTRVHRRLGSLGLGLLVHDAYRPWYVTKMFWEATPQELRAFVANPARGSRHNRGCAVDLTLFDRNTGHAIQMPSGYDEFTPRAYAMYPGGTSRQRYYRDLLRQAMEREGFSVVDNEWWHFDYRLWQEYGIQNVAFEDLDR